MMNCEGFPWKRSWPNFKVLSRHLLAFDGRKTKKTSVGTAGLRANNLTRDLRTRPRNSLAQLIKLVGMHMNMFSFYAAVISLFVGKWK
jgi:hypothetical protein